LAGRVMKVIRIEAVAVEGVTRGTKQVRNKRAAMTRVKADR